MGESSRIESFKHRSGFPGGLDDRVRSSTLATESPEWLKARFFPEKYPGARVEKDLF